ncbi:MAG: cation:proton antiporter [Burkholderiales bacterium]
MTNPGFMPEWPLVASPIVLFGLLLLAGFIGGELVHRLAKIPRLIGYTLTGLLLGPGGLDWLDHSTMAGTRVFVDISLGLLLFDLGRRLDLDWLARDRWLFITGLAESALSFGLVFFVLTQFEMPAVPAAIAAAIAIATSPAVTLVMSRELKAEGQITERMLNLTAMNSVIAVLVTTMLLSWIHHEYQSNWYLMVLHPLYLLLGSGLLGVLASLVVLGLARLLGKHRERHFVLVLAVVVLVIGVARMLELSVLLTMLTFGVLVRNLDQSRDVLDVDFGRVGLIFFVVLFVVSGASLSLDSLQSGAVIGGAYVLARFAGKALGVMTFTHFSGLRSGSSGLLALSLMPMSALAVAMLEVATGLYPQLKGELSAIVLSAVLILELAGPLLVQFALTRAGEARAEEATPT